VFQEILGLGDESLAIDELLEQRFSVQIFETTRQSMLADSDTAIAASLAQDRPSDIRSNPALTPRAPGILVYALYCSHAEFVLDALALVVNVAQGAYYQNAGEEKPH
jgi:hypothetical protein